MSDGTTYDVVVIGSGPGGYVAAIKAAQLGLRTAVVERASTFGGTCLNVGCIPSKALLHTSELFREAAETFPTLGIKTGAPQLDLAAMQAHKAKVVEANVTGVAFLFKKNKVDTFAGTGSLAGKGRVAVVAADGRSEILAARNVIIATGSETTPLPGVAIDEKRIVSSTGALALDRVPRSLLVIGGGVIGLELGSVWRRLGAEVTVVEFLDRILPGTDSEIARHAQRLLARQGIAFRLASKVTGIDTSGPRLGVKVAPAAGEGSAETLAADVALLAIGRRPFTAGLGLETAGIAVDERRRIKTDTQFRTSAEGIYAIGDVIVGPMLAHKAEDEGIAVAEIIAGQAGHVNYEVIPAVVYTAPEIASVGRSEDDLKAAGVAYTVGKFPFTANGRARAMAATDGFVKILADRASDRVLGVHILGAGASELIQEASVLMEFGGNAEDLARICHAHPSLSEAMREAALAAWSKPIHI